MTPQVDFARHTAIRDRIRSTLDELKSEGVSTSELLECVGNELYLLKIQDEREFKANAASMDSSGVSSSQNDQQNNR